MGTVCAYYPNTNEVKYVCKYDYNKEEMFKYTCNQVRGTGATVFAFDDDVFNNEEEIQSSCAIWTIKTLMELNNLTTDDVK
jgi:predicted patatin/cPLA2 family phospholipase